MIHNPTIHPVESILLALESANIPAERLVGCLLAAGFKVERSTLKRKEGCGLSKAATLRFIRDRRAHCARLFAVLRQEYPGAWPYRLQTMEAVDGHVNPLFDEEEEAVLERARRFEIGPLMVRFWRLERALVEAVKSGDESDFERLLWEDFHLPK